MEKDLTNTSLLDNRYTIVKLLGQGGMGKVYLAQDQRLDRQLVALKLLSQEYVQNERSKQRFLREVLLARKVSHRNIVRTHDIGECDQGLYLTMEYLEGQSLKELVNQGPLDLALGLRIALGVIHGLKAIHEAGIIHRDLKSANILITKAGEVKISDFGIASPGESDITKTHELLGSCQYLAPELWSGATASLSSDIYAFGIVAYEIFCGILPFEGVAGHELMFKHLKVAPIAPIDLVESITIEVNSLILDLLAKNPKVRPQAATDVIRRLEQICADPYASGSIQDSDLQGGNFDEIDSASSDPADSPYCSSSSNELSAFEDLREHELHATANLDRLVSADNPVIDQRISRFMRPIMLGSLSYLGLSSVACALIPELVKLFDALYAQSSAVPLRLLLGFGLILLVLPFFAAQVSVLSYLVKSSGGDFALRKIQRLLAAQVLLAFALAGYYLTIFSHQWINVHDSISAPIILDFVYESMRAALFNLSETLCWQAQSSGFLATKFVGAQKLGLDLSTSFLATIVPTFLALLMYIGLVLAVATNLRKTTIRLSLKWGLFGLFTFSLASITQYFTGAFLNFWPSLVQIRFQGGWERGVDLPGLLIGLTLFLSLALIAVRQHKI